MPLSLIDKTKLFVAASALEFKKVAYLAKANVFTADQQLDSGKLIVNGPTTNLIDFSAVGLSGPANGLTPPLGQKITLYKTRSATDGDYALGVDANVLWYSTGATTARSHKFYVANVVRLSVTNTGISVTGSLAVSSTVTAVSSISAPNFQNGIATRTADLVLSTGSAATNYMDCTAAARLVTLYTSTTTPGQRFTFVKSDASGNAVTITGTTINGPRSSSPSITLISQWDSVELESTSTAGIWTIVNRERRDGDFYNLAITNILDVGSVRIAGASKLGNYRPTTAATYDWTTSDKFLEVSTAGCVVTLPTATLGFDYYIINTSTGAITVQGRTAGQTIGNTAAATQSVQVAAGASLHVVANGNTGLWRVI